ncbi:MAG: tRNA (guanosine(37)-N1)-methyltransferase TrmD [Pseudomonadota bacterium]
MHIAVVTLFEALVAPTLAHGVVGRAVDAGRVRVDCVNPRQFAERADGRVDDRPFGGGPGMVLAYAPMVRAIEQAKRQVGESAPVIGLTPQGAAFDQRRAEMLATSSGFVLVPGRYEGIDERVAEAAFDEELSIGDYVLSGGELAAAVVIDAVARLVPGVLGDARSAGQDSFSDGLLDCPHYTRPDVVDGQSVPGVLLSGDHAQIARWRRQQSLGRTWQRRPDLLEQRLLSESDQALLDEYIAALPTATAHREQS